MKLTDLIKSNHWLSVEITLLELYPDQKKLIDEYKSVFERLRVMEPANDDMLIVLTEYECDVEDKNQYTSTYVDVSGRKIIPDAHSCTDSYAIEFVNWEIWIGMDLAPETIERFSELEIIAHCLYEMTFYGYEQDEIQEQLNAVHRIAEDYRNLSIEEKKQDIISLEDLMKRLDERDNRQL